MWMRGVDIVHWNGNLSSGCLREIRIFILHIEERKKDQAEFVDTANDSTSSYWYCERFEFTNGLAEPNLCGQIHMNMFKAWEQY